MTKNVRKSENISHYLFCNGISYLLQIFFFYFFFFPWSSTIWFNIIYISILRNKFIICCFINKKNTHVSVSILYSSFASIHRSSTIQPFILSRKNIIPMFLDSLYKKLRYTTLHPVLLLYFYIFQNISDKPYQFVCFRGAILCCTYIFVWVRM